MLKTFQVSGYAVNKRGNTVGVRFDVRASSIDKARQAAAEQASAEGYQYPRLVRAVALRPRPGNPQGEAYGTLSPAR
jgi:hypothetical protein